MHFAVHCEDERSLVVLVAIHGHVSTQLVRQLLGNVQTDLIIVLDLKDLASLGCFNWLTDEINMEVKQRLIVNLSHLALDID